jgi:hypothetical protein
MYAGKTRQPEIAVKEWKRPHMKSRAWIALLVAWGWTSLPTCAGAAETIQSVGAETKPVSAAKTQLAKRPRSLLAGLDSIPVQVRLPDLDRGPILAEDAQAEAHEKGVRIGVFRQLPEMARASKAQNRVGSWTALPDGGHVWRLSIESPGAIGIRVQVGGLSLPESCEIVAYASADPAQIRGPYAARALDGRNRFWTGTVFSEGVTVECYCPPDVPLDQVHFEVKQIIHIYRDPLAPAKVGNCHNDVTCYPEWAAVGNGVAGIGSVGEAGYAWCTGCLMNDQFPATFVDYFMTANHCVASQSEADDTEFYWFYQTGTCNGSAPSLFSVPRTEGGADYLAGRTEYTGNDFAFLRLRTASPGGVTYAGWSSATPGSSEILTGIHHPDGSYKRISFGRLDSSDANFWNVEWHDGVTEPGSSGSPLFNAQKEFIGQLYGGSSDCSDPSGIDYYGRFNISYPYVSQWLANPAIAIAPTYRLHSALAAAGQTIAVTASGAWTATANPPWISITGGGAGTGNGTVTYEVEANAGAIRSGTITVTGGGISRTFAVNQWPVPATPGVSAEGDGDGDGTADVSVFHPATGNWHVSFGAGAQWTVPWGWSAALPVPADYNGDGLLDFAVYHPATGNWHIQESGSVQSRIVQFGWNATAPVPGDYDGDGTADLAVFDQSQGRWHFRLSTGGADYSVSWGWATTVPVPADYDGDGKTDIAVYHPASGNWYVLKSSNLQMLQVNWGWCNAIPVPGDYDGDGLADIAVFHRASGNWYLRLSAGGGPTVQFGWSSVKPVAADYDGDGKTDIAVYHPATGNWNRPPGELW